MAMLEGHRAARIWWITRGHIAGSRNPTHQELRTLRLDGFSTIISLLDERDQPLSYDPDEAKMIGYVWHSMPIMDHCAPRIEQMEEFARIVEARSTTGRILVHCWAGLGRTGTMGAAYLICRGQSAGAAIAQIRRACPLAIETTQEDCLFLLEEALRAPR